MKKAEELLNRDKYQVFLMSCPCTFPVNFAHHMWFVVNEKGSISRWEVLLEKDCCGESWGHVYKNAQAPFKPFGFFKKFTRPLWNADIMGCIEGDEGSDTQKMVAFIKSSNETYPHRDFYRLLGPNSNTYIQWVLDQFPSFKVSTHWRAFGTSHKVEV